MNHQLYKKVVLVILDGFGIASPGRGNAITSASTPNIDRMVSEYPTLTLQASGPVVGLPWGEMGNSEVGHLNIGAGRIVGQDLPRITRSIQDRTFFSNEAFLSALDHAKKNNSNLHILGMCSNGGVHSFDEHLYALLGLAAEQEFNRVYVHVFTDGRDTESKAALEGIRKLEDKIQKIGVGEIATVTGRFYAMDRGKHWSQTESTYQALTAGKGLTAASAIDIITENYRQNIFDEMIPPTVIIKENKPVATIGDNDAIIFFNFRSDRALQLTQSFVTPDVVDLPTKHQKLQNLFFVTMTQYKEGLPVHIAFAPQDLKNNLAEVITAAGLPQFHIAESEKFAHVTSFFNGGRTETLPKEERLFVESPNNSNNYEDQPQMSAREVAQALVDKIGGSDAAFFVANFANADMVGHTGNVNATMQAVVVLDDVLEKIKLATLAVGGVLIITADHGNAEQMISQRTGEIDKDHTTNPVPFILIGDEFRYPLAQERKYSSLAAVVPAGVISDIAPTILDLLGLPVPAEMTGINLLDVIGRE